MKAFFSFDWLIPDTAIAWVLRATFSKPSLVLHTIWFIYWFAAKADIGLLTNVVSLEAIYLSILIGIQQMRHHSAMKKHVSNVTAKEGIK